MLLRKIQYGKLTMILSHNFIALTSGFLGRFVSSYIDAFPIRLEFGHILIADVVDTAESCRVVLPHGDVLGVVALIA